METKDRPSLLCSAMRYRTQNCLRGTRLFHHQRMGRCLGLLFLDGEMGQAVPVDDEAIF